MGYNCFESVFFYSSISHIVHLMNTFWKMLVGKEKWNLKVSYDLLIILLKINLLWYMYLLSISK